jgi:hypothetical protein
MAMSASSETSARDASMACVTKTDRLVGLNSRRKFRLHGPRKLTVNPHFQMASHIIVIETGFLTVIQR